MYEYVFRIRIFLDTLVIIYTEVIMKFNVTPPQFFVHKNIFHVVS